MGKTLLAYTPVSTPWERKLDRGLCPVCPSRVQVYAIVSYQIKICLLSSTYSKGSVLLTSGYRRVQRPQLSRKHSGQRLTALAVRGRGLPVSALPLKSPATMDKFFPF